LVIPHPLRLGCLALVLAGGVVCPRGCVRVAYAADKTELSKARAKFQQAIELEEAGNYADALQLYRDVGQVRMTPQVQFHIAVCEEKLGRLLVALGGYQLALEKAAGVGPEFQKEVEGRANAVRARIPKLVIERGEGAGAATIELDGVSLGASSIGVEVPLDPGPHKIQAKAVGHKQYASTIDVREGQVERITVTLETLSEDANLDVAPTVAAPTEQAANPAIEPKDTGPVDVAPAPRKSRIIPYAIGGFGAVALLNAGVFYLLERGKSSDLQTLCGTDHDCTDANPRPLVGDEVTRSSDLNDKMRLYATISQVSAVTGILALGVAGGLIVFEPKQPRPATAWSIQPIAPGAELGGLSAVGAF
jgi:hypothetical protein